MYRKLGYFFVFFSLILLCFVPIIRIYGYQIHTSQITYPLFFLLGFIVFIKYGLTKYCIDIYVMVLFTFLIFLITFLKQKSEAVIFTYFIYLFLSYFSLYYITFISFKHSINIIYVLWLVGVFHSVILIMSFVIMPFREFLYSFIVIGETAKHLLSINIRTTGLMYQAFSILSTITSLLYALGLFYKEDILLQLKNKFIYVFFQILIVLSVFVSGRTGIVNLFIITFLYIVFRKKNKKIKLNRKNIKFYIILIITFFIILGFLNFNTIDFSRFQMFIEWSFELFFNIFKGTFSTASTDALLKSQYHLPNDFYSLLVGTGEHWSQIGSDVGYVQIIYEVGFVGLLCIVLLISFFIIKNKSNNLYMYCYFLLFFICNLKDSYVFFLNGYTVCLLIPYFYNLNQKKILSSNIKPATLSKELL